LILTTQYQFWFGDYSRSDLEKIKEEISIVEKEIEIIKENNQELIDEKEKLNSGKDAIEGIARIELGMIKPGEKFFVFKSEGEEKNLFSAMIYKFNLSNVLKTNALMNWEVEITKYLLFSNFSSVFNNFSAPSFASSTL